MHLLTTHIFFFGKASVRTISPFKSWVVLSLLSWKNSFYILDSINPLQIFSPSRLLHFLIFKKGIFQRTEDVDGDKVGFTNFLMVCAFYVPSKKSLPTLKLQKKISPLFSLKSFIISDLMLSPMIHFRFNFCVSCSKFVFYMDIQLFQHHLLKRLSFWLMLFKIILSPGAPRLEGVAVTNRLHLLISNLFRFPSFLLKDIHNRQASDQHETALPH